MVKLSRVIAVWVLAALPVNLGSQGPVPGPPAATPRDTAQRPATGTGRIRGRVLAAGTNAPLRMAQLALRSLENPQFSRTVNTDAQGRYEFTELPTGRFSLFAGKPGYVGLQYGQRRAYETGTPIALTAGETMTPIDFALPRGSVVTGRIMDESNEVMPQIQVQVQRFEYSADGQRRLLPAGTDTTDDRGEFRVYGLMPGEYVVTGSASNSQVGVAALSPAIETREGYPPTFYPGTPNVNQAQPITLGIGEEISIQFALTAARQARISGTVRDSEGRLASGQVMLVPRNSVLTTRNTAAIGSDGSFIIRGVFAGEYTLVVRRAQVFADVPSRVPGI